MSSDHHPKTAGYIGMILACLVLLAGNGCGQSQNSQVEYSRYSALGEVMAAKLNEAAGGKGNVVLVVAQNDNDQPTAFGQAAAAFRKAMDKSFQVSVETVFTPAVQMSGSEPLSADKFAGLLQKYAAADYLVSFVGVPVLAASQMDQLPAPRPQVVEVVAYNPPTKAMFAKKVVCLAALAKPGDQNVASGTSSQDAFDACYQLVTPESAASLPH